MRINLDDKTILITGGLGAISEYVLKALHSAGAHLVVTDRVEPNRACEILSEWGLDGSRYLKMDVTKPDDVEPRGAVGLRASRLKLTSHWGTPAEPASFRLKLAIRRPSTNSSCSTSSPRLILRDRCCGGGERQSAPVI